MTEWRTGVVLPDHLRGRWLVTKTPVDLPYPCRCHESRYGKCNAAWCPCAGRTDLMDVPPDCCGRIYDAAAVVRAKTEWAAKRAQ